MIIDKNPTKEDLEAIEAELELDLYDDDAESILHEMTDWVKYELDN